MSSFRSGILCFHYLSISFTCYQVTKFPFLLIYRINKDDNEEVSISVKITAKAKDADTDPIMTKCWIETGTQQINSEADLKLSVVAEVRQVI